MEFKYLEENCQHPLIDHFYQLKINEEDLPFKTLIVPLGQNNITYVFTDKHQTAKIKGREIFYKDLVITGQIYGSYELEINSTSENIGLAMKPTSLYKILNTDISKLNDQHIPLSQVNKNLNDLFSKVFMANRHNESKLIEEIYALFENISISTDPNLLHIDNCIEYISQKEGLLQVNDLLHIIPLSQKTLEIQFKKIVGITPGKYIRHYRFKRLMQKYGSGKYRISDLMYMFDYYDQSHFTKDFKFFIGQNPTTYFRKNYPLIKEYLK